MTRGTLKTGATFLTAATLLSLAGWVVSFGTAVPSRARSLHDREAGTPATPGHPDAIDLCQGLVQDKLSHPASPLDKPALGEAITDPEFGTTIRRITAVSTAQRDAAVIKPMYGTIQAWNADESRLVLWHRERGHELYDGRTYKLIGKLDVRSPTDLEELLWDPVDPDVLYYPSNYNAIPNLMRYRVSTGRSEVAKKFDFCPQDWGSLLSLGGDPMYISWGPETKVIGLQCGKEKFLYDVASDRVLGRATLGARTAPQPGPSGRLAYMRGHVVDASLRGGRSLNLANGGEHASIGRSAATGHDVYTSVVFDPPHDGSEKADVGTLVAHDMETGDRRVIVGFATGYPYPPTGTHVSAIAVKRPGWVAVSVVGDPKGRGPLNSELLLANIDTGQVCRVAHHRSWAGEGRWGYWAEPHVVISPTGTRLLFGSDWGNGPSVDTYVVELPAYAATRGK